MTCHNCRIDARKFGRDRYGRQRYRCARCSKTFSEPHERPWGTMYLDEGRGLTALELIVNGMSLRKAEKISGVARNTIMRLLAVAGERAEHIMRTRIRNVPVQDVQCDEIWGFVFKKEQHKNPFKGDDMYVGDAWCFVAFERFTKLVLTFELGKRTETSTRTFAKKLAAATEGRFQVSTDGFPAYPYALGMEIGIERIDYAQIVKIYGQSEEGERRYSPPEVLEIRKEVVYGDPDPKRICTSHVERQNLNIRMNVRRLTRLTNAFSKKWQNHKAALALYFAYYNFCTVHGKLKSGWIGGPQVDAGGTDEGGVIPLAPDSAG